MSINSKTLLVSVNLLALSLLLLFAFTPEKQQQVGYVLNEELFSAFNGTKHYESELSAFRKSFEHSLDSLSRQTGKEQANLILEKKQQYLARQEALRQQHTARLWVQINQYLTEYGENNHYDFIYGASGNGNLMYASESKNITKEVLTYINKRYEGE